MVIVWPLAAKVTKAKAISLGGVVAALGASAAFSCLAFVGNEGAITGISIASFCIKAIGTAPAMYISLALMANVLDHQEAVHGIRTDGFSMAVYGSIMVAMSGICNGIIVGLDNAVTGDAAKQFLHTFLAFGVEGICYVIIAILFLFMNVERFTNVDNKAIVADQKAEHYARRRSLPPSVQLLLVVYPGTDGGRELLGKLLRRLYGSSRSTKRSKSGFYSEAPARRRSDNFPDVKRFSLFFPDDAAA